MLGAPIRSSSPRMRFPHSDGPRVHFEVNGAVRPRMEPRTALICVQMGQDTPESISPPSPASLPAFSLCQRRCRPPRCCGPPGDCRCERRPYCRHRDGERIKAAPSGRVRSLRGGSNREQALHSGTLKILPIPLTPPPAQLNHSALCPGLDSHAVIKRKGSETRGERHSDADQHNNHSGTDVLHSSRGS
jgi:hypothetical protein